MKPQIQLFPDYCSSGLWCGRSGVNLEPTGLGLSEQSLFLLKTWQSIFDRSPIQWEEGDARWVYAEIAIQALGPLVYLSVEKDIGDKFDILYGERLEEHRWRARAQATPSV